MGESQCVGSGTAGFGGAAAGLAAAGAAGLVCDEAELDSEDPEGIAFAPPALAGCSAAAFGSPSGGGELGDLRSSGIFVQAQIDG